MPEICRQTHFERYISIFIYMYICIYLYIHIYIYILFALMNPFIPSSLESQTPIFFKRRFIGFLFVFLLFVCFPNFLRFHMFLLFVPPISLNNSTNSYTTHL